MRSATMIVRIPGNWIGDLATSCDPSIKVIKCVPREGAGGQNVVQIDTVDGTTGTDLVDRIRAIEPKCRVHMCAWWRIRPWINNDAVDCPLMVV
jgi:hypothetical protein